MKFLSAYILAVCCTFSLLTCAKVFGLETNTWLTPVLCFIFSGGSFLVFKAALRD